jgi:hypothetical protein
MIRDATFSADGLHRLDLSRIWDESLGLAFYCGLNPSMAGKLKDDMTVRKGMGFARCWNLGGTLHGNVYSLISKDPKRLRDSKEALRIQENDEALLAMAKRARIVVLCWGAFAGFEVRFAQVAKLLEPFSPKCLGRTAHGFPRHISRIAYASALEPW